MSNNKNISGLVLAINAIGALHDTKMLCNQVIEAHALKEAHVLLSNMLRDQQFEKKNV